MSHSACCPRSKDPCTPQGVISWPRGSSVANASVPAMCAAFVPMCFIRGHTWPQDTSMRFPAGTLQSPVCDARITGSVPAENSEQCSKRDCALGPGAHSPQTIPQLQAQTRPRIADHIAPLRRDRPISIQTQAKQRSSVYCRRQYEVERL